MQWDNEILVDKVLPFGLRPAPFIFTTLADALQWIIEQNGAQPIFHYQDDYITIGPADSPHCSNNLSIIKRTCEGLGVPLEESRPDVVHHLLRLGIGLKSSHYLPTSRQTGPPVPIVARMG